MTLKVKAILAGIGVFLLIGVLPNLLALSAGIAYSPALLLSGLTGGVFVAMGVLNLGGNKQAPLADAQARAQALSLHPPAGMARLIVVREGIVAKSNGVDLELDGRAVAQLKSPRFTVLQLTPGQHMLRASLTALLNSGGIPATASFEAQAGQTLVYQMRLVMKLTNSDVVLERAEAPDAVLPRLARMKMVLASA